MLSSIAAVDTPLEAFSSITSAWASKLLPLKLRTTTSVCYVHTTAGGTRLALASHPASDTAPLMQGFSKTELTRQGSLTATANLDST